MRTALTLTGKFKSNFDTACEHDPGFALRHPQTTAFYAARAEPAVRAGVTRRKNRAAKKNNPT